MTESSMGTAEALASIALVAIAADGYLADQEGQDMTMLLSRMALFSSYSKDAVHHLFDLLLTRLKTEGPGAMVDQAKAVLPQDLRETAFAVATDLVLSDRTVTPQEQAFLEDLYRILEIPSPLAQQIVQVMTIKNRG
ncbi:MULTISPECIES: tellurite resistance TerB family protein [unclassified Nodosilinea]|uniref:Tellurite resistance TerB family protein n=1 Tax=Leptolyngbya subtilissima DQ-A4 TaxID=2933933 RepID=A0ABV0KCX8_9CYAN|nr:MULTISPECIES: tellurite resistance TerB family protein [unclassified Nodosilinea]MBD2109235.1 tellurite resistance TerB family protein [Nodosilinea sp. FACHB-13]MBD2113746.1 tellurite resistance TerB family protein [Nodosilinea sp. FACHB-141]